MEGGRAVCVCVCVWWWGRCDDVTIKGSPNASLLCSNVSDTIGPFNSSTKRHVTNIRHVARS